MVILISFLVFFALLCIGGMLIINNSVGKSGKQLFRMNTAKKIEPFAFLMPAVILLLIMFGFPLIRTLIMAFQNYKLTQPNKIYFNSFANFLSVYTRQSYIKNYKTRFKFYELGAGIKPIERLVNRHFRNVFIQKLSKAVV